MTDFIIRYRWFLICSCFALGLAFASLIPFSKTDPEIRNYIPVTMNSRIETDKIENEFGVQDIVMILFNAPNILTTENLKQIKEVDRDISRLSGISNRISPFTVRTIKNTDGAMTADPLIRRIPSEEREIDRLRRDILANRFARDIVFSSDLTTASITATINKSVPETVTLEKIDSILNVHPGRTEVLKGGLPYIRRHIIRDVRKDAVFLVPAALIVMLLILKLTLGDWKSVFMPFSVVIITTSISMGLIPLLGWKLSIMSLLVPIILVAVANNYGIYLVARFQELSLKSPDTERNARIGEIAGSLNIPILFSGLTTIAGILGLLTHSVTSARAVGILAAIGVSAALAMSLFLVPAMIYLRKDDRVVAKPSNKSSGRFEKLLSSLASLIVKHPGRIVRISVIITALIFSGSVFLKIETNQEKYFPGKSPVSRASELINSKFGGSQTISVMVSGDIKDPKIMQGIDNMALNLEKCDGVGEVFSISQAVREMSKALYSPDESNYDRIPTSREGIAQMFELYNMSGDPEDFRQMMNLDNTRAHILIRLSNPEGRVIRDVKAKILELGKSIPADITAGGYAIIMADFAKLIIKGQISSLVFALITVMILLAIIFRSFRGGLTGSIPLAASILVLFGFMGFAGIALDSATALLSSIMIGVGVDFTIQYIWCLNIQIRKGESIEDATRVSLTTIGRSIIINGLSVIAGFSVLMLSGFTSIRFFGYLVLISIGSCLAGALILIPAIIVKFRPTFVERDMSIRRKRTKEKRDKKERYEKEGIVINVGTAAFTSVSPAARCRPDYEQMP